MSYHSSQARQDAENIRVVVIVGIFIVLLIIGALIYFSQAVFNLFLPITVIVFVLFIILLFAKAGNYDVDDALKWTFIGLIVCLIVLGISWGIAYQFGTSHFGEVAKQTFDATFDHNKGLIGALN